LLVANNYFAPYRQDLITVNLSVTDQSSPGANDGAITLALSGGVPGYTYAWSNSATTANITNLGGGAYTITVTDTNGCTGTQNALIGVVGIENELNPPAIAIYPNPATEQFMVQMVNFKADMQLTIMDLVGKVVMYRTIPVGTDQLSISTIGIPKGVYSVQIQSGNHAVTKRVIIQ